MWKQLAAVVVAVAVIVVFIRGLTFGESPSPRARPAPSAPPVSATPSASVGATPAPDPDAVAIIVSDDRVTVRPRSAPLEARRLRVHLENRAPYMVELVFVRGPAARGEPRGTIVTLGTGEQRNDGLELAAGRYSVVARPLTEGDAPPAPAIGSAALRVR